MTGLNRPKYMDYWREALAGGMSSQEARDWADLRCAEDSKKIVDIRQKQLLLLDYPKQPDTVIDIKSTRKPFPKYK